MMAQRNSEIKAKKKRNKEIIVLAVFAILTCIVFA